jgi:hypothetical protein
VFRGQAKRSRDSWANRARREKDFQLASQDASRVVSSIASRRTMSEVVWAGHLEPNIATGGSQVESSEERV